MPKEHKYAFLDTNIFLHFQFFTEIDWIAVLQAKSVTLIIPPIVARELDKHKYNHSSERIKDRATKITKKFAEIFRSKGEVRPKVNIQFERIEPQTEFETYSLSKDSQDDHLIASILRFQIEIGHTAVLITNDFSFLVKAHQLNIEVVELPETYQIKPEENPDKKRIQKLEAEIREIKNRQPFLKLSSKCEILLKKKMTEKEIKAEIKNIKELYPKYKVPKSKPKSRIVRPIIKTSRGVNIFSLFPNEEKVDYKLLDGKIIKLYPQDIKNFNLKLDTFYKDYEKYLFDKSKVEELKCQTIKLSLEVFNEGNSSAKDIKITLFFPLNLRVTTDKEIFSYPENIEPPSLLPTMPNILGYNRSGYDLLNPNLFTSNLATTWERVKIEKTDINLSVMFESLKLNHGYSFSCPKTLYVTYPSNQQPSSFQVDYKITAENIPKAVEGKLNIIVQE